MYWTVIRDIEITVVSKSVSTLFMVKSPSHGGDGGSTPFETTTLTC